MMKKLNRLTTSAMIISVLFIILGMAMVLFPDTSLSVFSFVIASFLILIGLYLIFIDIDLKSLFFPVETLLSGVLSILLGIIICIYPNIIRMLVPIILGIWFIITSILKIRFAFYMVDVKNSNWLFTLIMGFISLFCGMILILNPLAASISITLFSGIIIIIYAFTELIDIILFKRDADRLAKFFKKELKK